MLRGRLLGIEIKYNYSMSKGKSEYEESVNQSDKARSKKVKNSLIDITAIYDC